MYKPFEKKNTYFNFKFARPLFLSKTSKFTWRRPTYFDYFKKVKGLDNDWETPCMFVTKNAN